MKIKNEPAVILLAAGTSSRLGETKQLLELNGKSLLNLAVNQALELSSNVTVVLGHENKKCMNEIKKLPVKTVINTNYKDGVGSSISSGVSSLYSNANVLIMLCDQPLIPLTHYKYLIKKSNENTSISIGSKHGSSLTVPAIFPKKNITSLKQLSGDECAKDLLCSDRSKFVCLDDSYLIGINSQEDWYEVINSYEFI